MGSRIDLLELARHLRQEHLFVNSERQQIQNLNDKVLKAVEKLFHVSWIAKHQRVNLDSLIYSKPLASPSSCCHRANTLEQVLFIDSYKQLNIHDAVYAEFLQLFREDPKLIALCLVVGENINLESMQINVPVIMSAIYGNSVLPEDEVFVQKLLKELIVLQLSSSDNPRRLLRHGSGAFSQVYKPFSEGLFSAKLFLTATLHEAIMHLLMEDDLFLDIDPGKAVVRFPPQERLRHFGREGTSEYAANLQKYRNRTIGRLVKLANRFIDGIRSNIYCFPQSISWLVRQLYDCVMKAKKVEVREVGAMCADLVFAFFICPAIVNPEPYGITDAPISDIARFNLMQVAQILQVLAMSKWEDIDPKLMDLYGKFEKDCMSSILDLILEGTVTDDSPSSLGAQMSELSRFAVLITESELLGLVSFLSSIQNECADENLQKTLSSLIASLPASVIRASSPAMDTRRSLPSTPASSENLHLLTTNTSTHHQTSTGTSNAVSPSNVTTDVPAATPGSTEFSINTPSTPISSGSATTSSSTSAKKNLLGKVSRRTLKATLSSHILPQSDHSHHSHHEDHLMSPSDQTSSVVGGGDAFINHNSHSSNNTVHVTSTTSIMVEQPLEDVLVIPINNAIFDCPGMLTEEKVLSLELQQKQQNRVRHNLESLQVQNQQHQHQQQQEEEVESNASGPQETGVGEKRTRFSLSQDQESIGASDNLEAISEAASNHSVASSLDMEENDELNENDNLSDMVSANVSGRGTPNVSGRDTPSSQLEGGDEQLPCQQRPLDNLPIINTRKQNRADIEDKFGKFEIQPMTEGDETKSMVSDTWSTDVLASDSETVEQSDLALQIIMESQNFPPPGLLDISETASQSDAWSTDVVTSDTERMQELDMDDTASVARSDEVETASSSGIETARSEPDFSDELDLINVVSPGILERPLYFGSSGSGGASGSAVGQNVRGRRGSHGLTVENVAFREVSSITRRSQHSEGSVVTSAFKEVISTRRSSHGGGAGISGGPTSSGSSGGLGLRDLPPKHSDLTSPDGCGQATESPSKDSTLLKKSFQPLLQSKLNESPHLNPKQYFNPLTVDVDVTNNHRSNSPSSAEINTSSPSVMDDLTPTGGSPPLSGPISLENSSSIRVGGHLVHGRCNQDTILSMQSLGRLSLAVRELSDSGDQDCAAFLLDTLQESNAAAAAANSVTSASSRTGSGGSSGITSGVGTGVTGSQRSRSSIADLLALDLTKTLILNEPGQQQQHMQHQQTTDTLKPSASGNSLLEFEQEMQLASDEARNNINNKQEQQQSNSSLAEINNVGSSFYHHHHLDGIGNNANSGNNNSRFESHNNNSNVDDLKKLRLPPQNGGVDCVSSSSLSSKRLLRGGGVHETSQEGYRTRLSSASMSSSSSSCSGSAEAYARGQDVGQELVGDAASNAQETQIAEEAERAVIKDRIIQAQLIPGALTGAIPKSISFDKSADKAFRDLDADEKNENDKNRKSFFKLTNFRFTFKGRNRKPRHLVGNRTEGYSIDLASKDRHAFRHLQRNYSDDATNTNALATGSNSSIHAETTDEILAKYRKKTPNSAQNINNNVESADASSVTSNDQSALGTENVLLDQDDSQVFEPAGSSSVTTFVFNDAKRKLRMVLGSADIQTLPWLSSSTTHQNRLNGPSLRQRDNDLVAFLKVLLAEAINLQQRPLVAHLHEALRCVRMFDESGCQKLLKSLKGDYRHRAPYISYLVRCRQGLLSTLAHLEALQGRIHRDKDVCSKYLITLCVRTFLEKREKNIELFLRKFQALTVADEMAQLVEKFLAFLYSAMDTDPLWQTASQEQLEHAHTVIERTIMSQIYIRALYPNGDGDALRDQVFYQHLQKLSMVITLDHKDLRIPKIYHHECPWPSAQAEIITINAYKTPRDKIQCVLRCCSTIMNLLVMAGNKSVPAADDFMPVLVYVLIKANPPSLLSAKEYINTFYEKQLEGEDSYWWTQFSSAVEFIKTMDY